MECFFCKIIKKQASSKIIYEDEEIICFKDINPEAPIHLLLIPKKHIEWKNITEKDCLLMGRIITLAKNIAGEQKINQAYKLIFNIGKTGHIPHIHLHLLGGWKGEIPTYNIN